MRYTKQAMTLAQQIQTLQSRGLIIADTNKETLEVISLGELSKLFNNFSESQLKHDVAHEFGLNQHKFLSSWLESLTSLRNHCAHHARVWNRAYPLKPTTPQVMPNKWITNFTFREESLYAQLCCIAYWLNSIDANNTFVGDLKLLLLRNPSIDPAMMGFPRELATGTPMAVVESVR